MIYAEEKPSGVVWEDCVLRCNNYMFCGDPTFPADN